MNSCSFGWLPLAAFCVVTAACGGGTASGTGSSLSSSSSAGGGSVSSSTGSAGEGGMGMGGAASSSSSGGAGGSACMAEICNGLDDDCNGVADDAAGLCNGPGEICSGGACKADCTAPGANACAAGTVCNVSDANPGACVAEGSACLVAGGLEPCGAWSCGPGSTCDSNTLTCVAALPCLGAVCTGSVCHGSSCPCERPAPACAPATLDQLNNTAFINGLVDLDFDLSCGAWGVTVISGADYLRNMDTAGLVKTVQGVTNLNMGEVAAVQGQNGTFGGMTTDVGLTYNCCAACGCQGTPQGVAFYDQPANTLPLVIPSAKITTGLGPFQSAYLDTGPQGLTWGLSRKLYVGNVDQDGDFHAVDLTTNTKGLVTTFPARVYAATPFDGTRLLVALATKDVVLLDVVSGLVKPFATLASDVTSMARDPFTGHVYISLNGGAIRDLSAKGDDLGKLGQGLKSGRIALARDGYLYHLNAAPVGVASVERFVLPTSY